MVGTQMPDLDNLELHTRRHIEQELAESMVYESICHLTVVYVKDMKIWIGQNYHAVQYN